VRYKIVHARLARHGHTRDRYLPFYRLLQQTVEIVGNTLKELVHEQDA
jgi:hypothetical protein